MTIRGRLSQFAAFIALILLASSSAFAQSPQGFDPRPFELGTSGGNIKSIRVTRRSSLCCSGTLGSLVQDSGGKQYILSNNHVLARQSTHSRHAAHGESILQPGLVDSGCQATSSDVAASLSNWIPLQITRSAKNVGDAAIAEVIGGDVDPSGRILNIGALAPAIVASNAVTLGLAVKKMGRTTGLTTGQVSAVGATILVRYPKECNSIGVGVARFLNQVVIEGGGAFSDAGDSGSLVATQDSCPRAVALLFADGTDRSGTHVTFANPIDSVLSGLNVTMVGTCTSSSTMVAQNDSAGSPGSSAATPDAAFARAMTNAKAIKDRHDDELMNIPGVVGTAIGKGSTPGQVAIHVYVQKDTPEVRKHLPNQIEGVPVIIRETGDINAL